MNVELDDNEIAALLSQEPPQEPRTRKLTRTKAHYAKLPEGGPVTLTESTSRCASRGCSSPTWYKLRGVPYCSTHLIVALTQEIVVTRGYNSRPVYEEVA